MRTSIAAILNKHQSGELYFGVKNDGTVLGQEIGDSTLRTVSQSIRNHIRPMIYPEIMVKDYDGNKVVYVKFSGTRCPYTAFNIARIRVSDEDVVMDQETYEDMMRKRDNISGYSWESQVSKYRLEDVNEEALQAGTVCDRCDGLEGRNYRPFTKRDPRGASCRCKGGYHKFFWTQAV